MRLYCNEGQPDLAGGKDDPDGIGYLYHSRAAVAGGSGECMGVSRDY